MAATLTRERFTGADWIFERKLDGIRLLAFKRGTDVQLFSRNRLPQNDAYPSFAEAIRLLPPVELILDGEATGVWNARDPIGYHVFDVLWLDGRSWLSETLEARREALLSLPLRAPLELVPRLEHSEPWALAAERGWEGVIAKRRDSVYEQRRSRSWLKMKVEASQELVVGGFTEPRGKRVGLGALLVGYFEASELVFAGKLGTGFDTKLLTSLREQLGRLEVSETPFTRAEGLPRKDVHWVEPQIVVQVAFMEWTSHGKLRHPRLVGVRTDKAARDVTREVES